MNFIFKLSKYLELKLAALQGKGYGAFSTEKEVAAAVKLLNGNPKFVIDIGGNVGNYTSALIKVSPAAKVHLFEPSKACQDELNQKFNKYPNIKIIPCAVSKENGNAILHSDFPGSGLASLTKRKLDHFNVDFKHSENIQMIKFENYWIEELDKSPIDLVKIDIEGHELDALHGFGEALNHIKIIQFEFGGCNIDTRTYFQDFWYFFQESKFKIYRITPIGIQEIETYSELDEFFTTTNFLAKNLN